MYSDDQKSTFKLPLHTEKNCTKDDMNFDPSILVIDAVALLRIWIPKQEKYRQERVSCQE